MKLGGKCHRTDTVWTLAILGETPQECSERDHLAEHRSEPEKQEERDVPRRGTGVITPPHLVTLNVSTVKNDEGQTLDKPRLMTISTRVSMMIARLDINAGPPKRLPTWSNALQVVAGRPFLFEGGFG
jgi:hypothetical protein